MWERWWQLLRVSLGPCAGEGGWAMSQIWKILEVQLRQGIISSASPGGAAAKPRQQQRTCITYTARVPSPSPPKSSKSASLKLIKTPLWQAPGTNPQTFCPILAGFQTIPRFSMSINFWNTLFADKGSYWLKSVRLSMHQNWKLIFLGGTPYTLTLWLGGHNGSSHRYFLSLVAPEGRGRGGGGGVLIATEVLVAQLYFIFFIYSCHLCYTSSPFFATAFHIRNYWQATLF